MSQTTSDDEDVSRVIERSARLRAVVVASGGPTAVSKISGLPAQTIQNYMGGRDMKVDALVALAAACNVSMVWLATGLGQKEGGDQTAQNCMAAFGPSLYQPANFWGFCLLLATCQEWHTKMNVIPTLAEVFEWIGAIYPKSLGFQDRQITLKNDEAQAL